MQNTGLLESGDALRGTPLRMGVPLLLLVGVRGQAKLAAHGVGFEHVFAFTDADAYERGLDDVLGRVGPVLVSVDVELGSEGSISRSPHEEGPCASRGASRRRISCQ